MKKLHVYIASPYTNGDKKENVERQISAAGILIQNGYTPFIPLLSHYAEYYLNFGEKKWFDWDIEWLKKCDILVRIRGFNDNNEEIYSEGADKEVKKAIELGIPVYVFDSVEKLEEWCDNTCENIEFKL